MDIKCIFSMTSNRFNDNFYTCIIKDQEIPKSNYKLNGRHENNETNNDVRSVWINNCNISKVPQGLSKIFPNLEELCIENSNLTNIYKTDLDEYKRLREFLCERNQVEILVGNLLEDFENLEEISFRENKLKTIEPNILDGLNKLNYVDFEDNVNYDCIYSSDGSFGGSTLAEIKEELFKKFFSSGSQEIKKFVNRFHKRIQRLKNSNEKLRFKLQTSNHIEQKLREQNQKLKDANESLLTANQKSANTEKNLKEEILKLRNAEKELNKEVQKLKQSENELKIKLESKVADQQQKGFQTDIQTLLQGQSFKDFKIQIDNQEFAVHKFLLAARSSTLAEIFLKNPEAEKLNLVDISVETFEIILHFIYTDELPSDDGIDFLNLYSAAGRLRIKELEIFAHFKVLNQINEKNAIEGLIVANKYGHNKLRQRAFEEIKKLHPDLSENWIDKPEKVKKFIEVFGEN